MNQPIYRCKKCNGTEVHVAMWVHANTNEVLSDLDLEAWCDTCEDHGSLKCETTMTPKQYIIEALSAAADNAHDMNEIDSHHELDYAVGVVTNDILSGDGDSVLDGGYFDVNPDVQFTRNQVTPHLIDAVSDFIALILKQHQVKTGGA